MPSMTFTLNDIHPRPNAAVRVTVTENANGTVTFDVVQLVGVGDLRGLFFDLADERLLGTLSVTGAVKTPADGATAPVAQPVWTSGNDSVRSAGSSSNNMSGRLGSDGGYDFGIEIGTEGIGTNGDDVRSFSFTLDSSLRDLTLTDFGG